jgi:hypothetical protein
MKTHVDDGGDRTGHAAVAALDAQPTDIKPAARRGDSVAR